MDSCNPKQFLTHNKHSKIFMKWMNFPHFMNEGVTERVRNLLKVLQWLECHSDLGWLFYRWKTKLTELRFFMLGCIFLQKLEADSSVEYWWRPGGPFSTLKALIVMIDSRTMTPHSCLPRAATPDVTKQLVKGSSCLFHARAWHLLLGLEFPLNPQIG